MPYPITKSSLRTEQHTWLCDALAHQDEHIEQITPLAEHADTRKYLRIQGKNSSWICLQAEQNHDLQGFVTRTQQLRANGLPVPQLYDHNISLGMALLSDHGDYTLLKQVRSKPYQQLFLYEQAIRLNHRLQQISIQSKKPAYSTQAADQNIKLCEQWYCEALCGKSLENEAKDMMQYARQSILKAWQDIPQTTCHRDFHGDNIMVSQPENSSDLTCLDYQDICEGPFVYDLASLLNDHYTTLHPMLQKHLLHIFFRSS